MTHASNRLRLILLLVFSAALALGSLWVREVMRRGNDDTSPGAVRVDPDYFIDNFNFVKASTIGQARYAVSGTKLIHYPKDDSYEITLPVVKSLSSDRPSIIMNSQRALSNSDASEVKMYDNVQVDRPESPKTPHFHMTTEYLEIYPDDDVIKTDKPVDIVQGTAEMTGVGMYGNNATLVFSLSQRTRSVVQPQKKH